MHKEATNYLLNNVKFVQDDINIEDKFGKTALDWANWKREGDDGKTDDIDEIKKILDKNGARVSEKGKKSYLAAICSILQSWNPEMMKIPNLFDI